VDERLTAGEDYVGSALGEKIEKVAHANVGSDAVVGVTYELFTERGGAGGVVWVEDLEGSGGWSMSRLIESSWGILPHIASRQPDEKHRRPRPRCLPLNRVECLRHWED